MRLRKSKGEWKGREEVDKFNYLGLMINTDGGMGRKWLIGCLREERYGEDGRPWYSEK